MQEQGNKPLIDAGDYRPSDKMFIDGASDPEKQRLLITHAQVHADTFVLFPSDHAINFDYERIMRIQMIDLTNWITNQVRKKRNDITFTAVPSVSIFQSKQNRQWFLNYHQEVFDFYKNLKIDRNDLVEYVNVFTRARWWMNVFFDMNRIAQPNFIFGGRKTIMPYDHAPGTALAYYIRPVVLCSFGADDVNNGGCCAPYNVVAISKDVSSLPLKPEAMTVIGHELLHTAGLYHPVDYNPPLPADDSIMYYGFNKPLDQTYISDYDIMNRLPLLKQ